MIWFRKATPHFRRPPVYLRGGEPLLGSSGLYVQSKRTPLVCQEGMEGNFVSRTDWDRFMGLRVTAIKHFEHRLEGLNARSRARIDPNLNMTDTLAGDSADDFNDFGRFLRFFG
jgi:hypothetical protein